MLYSDLYLQRKNNNSFIFMSFVAIVMVSVLTFYFFNQTALPTRASKNIVKRNDVVNVSIHQVGIFWQVEQADNGWIILGKDPQKLGTIELDDRDTAGQKGKYKLHYATLDSLDADTTYYYKIVSDNKLISRNGTDPFSFKTPKDITFTSSRTPTYGKVILPNGEPAEGALVMITYKNAYPYVALTKMSGEWLIPLQYILDKTTNKMEMISEKSILNMEVMNDDLTSKIEVISSRTSPIPQTIILGQDYSFVEEKNEVLPAFIKRETQKDKTYTVDVTYPKANAMIPGNKPLIRGNGVPGTTVIVNINSKLSFSSQTTVDDGASWNVPVAQTLLPGTYTLLVTTQDSAGKSIGFRRKFTIAKSGEQVVLGESTGSATLSPSPSPTAAPTTIAMISATPMPTSLYNVTDVPEPPATGGNIGMYVLTGLGLVILGAGIFLFL